MDTMANKLDKGLAELDKCLHKGGGTMDRWEVWKAYKLADEHRRAILDVVLRQVLEGQHQQGGGEVVNLQEAARNKTNMV